MPRIQPFTPLLAALANPFCSFRFALFISRMQAMKGGLKAALSVGAEIRDRALGVLQALAGLQAFVSLRPGSGQALTPHGPPAWRLPGA